MSSMGPTNVSALLPIRSYDRRDEFLLLIIEKIYIVLTPKNEMGFGSAGRPCKIFLTRKNLFRFFSDSFSYFWLI